MSNVSKRPRAGKKSAFVHESTFRDGADAPKPEEGAESVERAPRATILEVRSVLAGAYRARREERRAVTHLVEVDLEGSPVGDSTLCGRVDAEQLCDVAEEGQATCPACLKKHASWLRGRATGEPAEGLLAPFFDVRTHQKGGRAHVVQTDREGRPLRTLCNRGRRLSIDVEGREPTCQKCRTAWRALQARMPSAMLFRPGQLELTFVAPTPKSWSERLAVGQAALNTSSRDSSVRQYGMLLHHARHADGSVPRRFELEHEPVSKLEVLWARAFRPWELSRAMFGAAERNCSGVPAFGADGRLSEQQPTEVPRGLSRKTA